MTPLEKLSLMVLGTLAVLWAAAWVVAETVVYFTKDEK
jgi:hypothetical protein